MRQNAEKADLSSILPEELEARVKDEAEISTGCDISESDLSNIKQLCDQVLSYCNFTPRTATVSRLLFNSALSLFHLKNVCDFHIFR